MLRELFTDVVHAGYKSVIDGVRKIEAVGKSGLSERKRRLGPPSMMLCRIACRMGSCMRWPQEMIGRGLPNICL
jgi:hypothetical protein